jgi:hypothetical protein
MPKPSLGSDPNSLEIKCDGNGQEYVETCDGWVRATLVMFDGEPHIRIQEHHEAGSGRLHLGPLVPLPEWFAFKEGVDRLVGPYIRRPRRTLSDELEYKILENLAANQNHGRRRELTRGGVLSEPQADDKAWEYAYCRLCKRGILRLYAVRNHGDIKDGEEYREGLKHPTEFFNGNIEAEITPEGWSHWESLKAKKEALSA